MIERRMIVAIGVVLLTATMMMALSLGTVSGSTAIPKFDLPVFMTSPGQAPDGVTAKTLFDRARVPVSYDPFYDVKQLGTAKTIVLIIGGSGKGLGQAGVDLIDEIKRAENILKFASDRKIPVIGLHIGGEGRRGDASQALIETITHRCSLLVVRSDGNKDGLFTKIATDKKIPIRLIERTTELSAILTEAFTK